MTERLPRRVVPVVLKTADGQLIMQQRDHNPKGAVHLRGKVDFFGGHIEPGETAIMAAVREITEELELNLNPNHLKHIGSYQKDIASHGDNNIFEVMVYDLPVDARQLVVHEGAGYVLVTPENYHRLPVATFSLVLLKSLFGLDQSIKKYAVKSDPV